MLAVSACSANTPQVCFEKSNGSSVCVQVELARKPEQRQLGLKYRKSLKENHGMLFLFDQEGVHSFTMRNTYIPLDMIFIDRTQTVIGIVENAPPMTRGPYGTEKVSLYVLEVNAFFCCNNEIGPGDRVVFKNIPD